MLIRRSSPALYSDESDGMGVSGCRDAGCDRRFQGQLITRGILTRIPSFPTPAQFANTQPMTVTKTSTRPGSEHQKGNPITPMDTTDQNLKLGKWLKAKRKAAGLTPSQLAKVIGRPPSFIEKYEAGGRIEIPHLVEVATILKASLHEAVQLVEGKPNA
jgi:hypothetical protein